MSIQKKKLSRSFLVYMSLFIITQLSLLLSVTYVSGIIACVTAVIWMVITIPVYCLFKKFRYFKYVYPILNAVTAGVTISAYYTIENVKLQDSFLWLLVPLLSYLISFLIALYITRPHYIGIINISSLIMFAGVFIIVLLIITEGDAIGILDLGDFGDSNNRRRSNVQ